MVRHPRIAAGGDAPDAAGGVAGGAPGGPEDPKTLRQQACATDDGEFEEVMAKFEDLERQEAAAHGRASAAGLLLLLVLLRGRLAVRTLDNMRCLPHAYKQ